MTTNPMMQKNPLMSAWLSAANASAGAWRGLWMAEMHRQQAAMTAEFGKQMMRFWTGAWMVQPAPGAAAPAALAAPSAPSMSELGAAVAEAGAASRRGGPGDAAAARLRTLVERRTAGPAAKRKTRAAR